MKRFALLAVAFALLLAVFPRGLAEGERIALICGVVGDDPYLNQAVDKLEDLQEVFGYELTVLECADEAAWARGYIAAVDAGCELIVGVGPQAAGHAAAIAEEPREGIAFAVIDADAGSDGVASFSYSVEQAAWVVGVMAAAAFPAETRFGYVGSLDDAADFRCRWGFARGALSVTPEARFAFAYTGEGADPAAARELALELREAGCAFVYAGAGAGNEGIFEAALSLADGDAPLYTIGQDVDRTGPENPCILASQLKSAGVAAAIVVDNFYAGTLTPGLTVLDMATGTVGVSHVTAEGAWRNEAVLTDAVLERCRAAADRIVSGELEVAAPADAEGFEFPGF